MLTERGKQCAKKGSEMADGVRILLGRYFEARASADIVREWEGDLMISVTDRG